VHNVLSEQSFYIIHLLEQTSFHSNHITNSAVSVHFIQEKVVVTLQCNHTTACGISLCERTTLADPGGGGAPGARPPLTAADL